MSARQPRRPRREALRAGKHHPERAEVLDRLAANLQAIGTPSYEATPEGLAAVRDVLRRVDETETTVRANAWIGPYLDTLMQPPQPFATWLAECRRQLLNAEREIAARVETP